MIQRIKRSEYLQELIDLKDTNLIKVVTGIRRCGKSTLFELYQDYLIEQGVTREQILSINFEDVDYEDLNDYKKLYTYVKERLIPDQMNYIFLDEIQNVDQFQKAVDSLYIKKNVDLYITGSNAYLLSGEMATLLSGRYVEISMLPLSFKEYLSAMPDQTDLSRKFRTYQTDSSFPGALELKGRQKIREYLGGIYNTIVLKDVVSRLKIADVFMLESVIKFMFDNVGNLCSTKKIADTMTSDGRPISVHTVERYLNGLVDSFILYRVGRYDVKGKQYLKTGEKYYIADVGLRYYLLGTKDTDRGHLLENIIYLELLRRGYEVYIGKVGVAEVDFIAINENGTAYYQVALSVRDEQTLKRELEPLDSITDHNPKFLLTLDDDPVMSYNGIRQVNAIDWLIG
ncbi:ATP-binding protein [Anaerolentibacter hominis]|uniref:ATP-binding protein n=1 Tax=Anaerolentibacter hominis TaxID=3079009 RepID=UPI0031B89653